MADVKGPRGRSVQTRRRIVAAAHDLFASHGYAGTTLQAVADKAGVSVQTVYFHYGTKSRLLKDVVDVASAGDDRPVPLLDRDWFARLRAEPDPRAVVSGWVHAGGQILARVAPILAIVHDAASTDPEMAEQWQVNSRQRREAYGAFVGILARLKALPPGMTRARATDITVALLAPELFLVLTRDCGWSLPRWERWTTDHLAHDLLAA
jgi:AcrR family transcriptional regulator